MPSGNIVHDGLLLDPPSPAKQRIADPLETRFVQPHAFGRPEQDDWRPDHPAWHIVLHREHIHTLHRKTARYRGTA